MRPMTRVSERCDELSFAMRVVFPTYQYSEICVRIVRLSGVCDAGPDRLSQWGGLAQG